MSFEEFLKKIAPKIGPKNAFDLARDSRLKALEKILISKCGVTQQEIDIAVEEELGQLADNIEKMPPPPSN
ncbi:MAG: hypothetical protein Q8O88_05570 [bacterium]|nr:hypothetical protein [bacterium]